MKMEPLNRVQERHGYAAELVPRDVELDPILRDNGALVHDHIGAAGCRRSTITFQNPLQPLERPHTFLWDPHALPAYALIQSSGQLPQASRVLPLDRSEQTPHNGPSYLRGVAPGVLAHILA